MHTPLSPPNRTPAIVRHGWFGGTTSARSGCTKSRTPQAPCMPKRQAPRLRSTMGSMASMGIRQLKSRWKKPCFAGWHTIDSDSSCVQFAHCRGRGAPLSEALTMASCTRACLPACLELAATAQRSGSGMLARAAARQCGSRGGGALPADDSMTRGGEITDEGMSLNGTGFKELAVQYSTVTVPFRASWSLVGMALS